MSEALAARLGRDFQRGDILFREGDPGDVMYVIQSGCVRITKRIDGQEATIAELRAGECVGEVALFTNRARSATAVVVQPTRCIIIDVVTLELMVTKSPEIAVRFIRSLAARLEDSNAKLQILAHRDSRTRFVLAVAHHAQHSMEQTPEGAWIRRSIGDVAVEAAVPEHEIAEIARRLIRLDLIRVDQTGILVPNVTRLYEFVEFADG
ncbi:MAG: Crp/Fnr family transcriptional regulator [Polyangiaceae bacterium]|nr:Crp/Fnr family transcriptional regulator [Polyangiaceae bacterium]